MDVDHAIASEIKLKEMEKVMKQETFERVHKYF